MANVTDRIAELSPDQIGLLMKRLLKQKDSAVRTTIPSVARETTAFPLSFTQQRQWFMEQLRPDTVYNVPQALKLTGQVDVEALEQALSTILQRHEALRTTFQIVDGQPAQVITPAQSWKLSVVDVRDVPPDERAAEIERRTTEEARYHFNLAAGPLWRTLLLRQADDEYMLIVTMHHIIADGWSFGVAMRELAALYQAYHTGKPATLPALQVQYVDFAVWQREWLSQPGSQAALEQHLSYWKAQLHTAPPHLELPTDRPRPPVQTFHGAITPFAIDSGQIDSLRTLADQEGATLFMILLAAFNTLLYRYTNQQDVCIGTPVANRTRPELEDLIGLFINTLVLRTDLSNDPTFRELVSRVRRTALEAYTHQDLPFEQLVEVLQPDRDPSYSPIFQVLFVQTDAATGAVTIPGLTVQPVQLHSGTAQFDLSLYVTETSAGIQGFFEYNTDLFDGVTIERLARHFLALLDQIVKRPDERLSVLLAAIPIQKLSVVVASAFTAAPLADSLAFWMEQLHIPAQIRFAPYSQIFQQLLNPTSMLATNHAGVNVLLLRLEDWVQQFTGSPAALRDQLKQNVHEFLDALAESRASTHAPGIVCICPPSPVFMADPEQADFVGRMERLIKQRIAQLDGVTMLSYTGIAERYAVDDLHDPQGDTLGHIPYTAEFFAVLGTQIARAIFSLPQTSCRALLLDGQETLLSIEPALSTLQRAGIQLGVCARPGQTEANVAPQIMQLAAWCSSQEPLVDQVASLTATIGCSLNECIYISMDTAACADLRAAYPDLLALQLPSEPGSVAHFIEHLWKLN